MVTCTMQPNMAVSSSSGEKKFKGVRRRKWGRWVSEIRLPHSRERIWLGSYDSPEKAARAFDAAYICLRGPGGADELNFPRSPPPDVDRTSDPDEVCAAAKSHANRAVVVSGAGDAAPCRDTMSEEAHDDGAPQVDPAPVSPPGLGIAPLQVPDESSDWLSRLRAELPPLYSPLYVGSHAYTYVPADSSLTAADDINNMEENESVWRGLWSFDSSEGAVDDDHVVDVQRNLTYSSSSFPDVQ